MTTREQESPEAVDPIVRGTPLRAFDPSASEVVDSAAHHLASLTARAARATVGLIYLADGALFRLVGESGLRDRRQVVGGTPVSSTAAGLVLTLRQPVIIADAREDARVPPEAPILAHGGRAFAAYPIHDTDGEIVGVCAAMDYAPHTWAAEALAALDTAARVCSLFLHELGARAEADRQHRFLDAMLERLRVGVAGCDSHGRVVFANSALGRLGLDGFHHHDPASLPLARALAGEVVRDAEIVLPTPDGVDRVLLADAEPLCAASGEQLGAVLSVWDATNRRRSERFLAAERAVREVLADAHSIVEAGPAVLRAVCRALDWPGAQLWLVDEEADVLRVVAGYPEDGGDRPNGPALLHRGVGLPGAAWERDGAVWARELSGAGVGGNPAVHPGVAIPVPNAGSTLGVLCFAAEVAQDAEDTMTDLLSGIAGQIAQFLLRRRVEDAELALARSKDEYLFLVGHELRTPLTSIASYTELLAETPGIDQGSVRLLEVIDRNTSRLRHIIDELLDLAALDSGHAELVWERIDLAAIAGAALEDTRAIADEAGVTLRAEIAPDLAIEGDGERLRQVLDHLLRNAVAHSRDGLVTLSAAPSAAEGVDVIVADTGVGIAADESDEVLQPFYRTVLSREQQLPGAGLGLALSRAIVQAHHGTLRLTPNQPQGTRAVIRLPRVDRPA